MRRFATLAAGLTLLATAAPAMADGAVPTYTKDVSRILQARCQDCHRPGQVAPFSLLTYEQARKRASDIGHVTGEKIMPPWPASTNVGGPFRDARVLSDAEIKTLADWAAADCPEGDPKDAPAPREFSSDWPMGPPDLVVTMPEPYKLEASGDDVFRVFVLPTNLPEDRWIRAVDLKPGNRAVVHHVIAGVDTSGRGRELDAADPGPGYEALGGFGPGVPIRAFLPIWVPGSTPRNTPEGSGYVLPKGADLLIQMHYHKNGKPETDATSIGLYLTDKPQPRGVHTGFVFPNVSVLQGMAARAKLEAAKKDGRRPTFDEMLRDVLVIPAGEAHHEVKASTAKGATVMGRPLPRDILLTAVMPHMHWLGKDFNMTAVLPDEAKTRIPLIEIKRWDFNWQGTYAFEKPIPLPMGTTFEMNAHFDNSAANPANPSKPPREVRWGEQTTDEMCIGIFEFINATDDDTPQKKPKQDAPKSASR
ncbi:ascorbate-dependent monooxygenase [Isosphaeraceae bacterium EP7]